MIFLFNINISLVIIEIGIIFNKKIGLKLKILKKNKAEKECQQN